MVSKDIEIGTRVKVIATGKDSIFGLRNSKDFGRTGRTSDKSKSHPKEDYVAVILDGEDTPWGYALKDLIRVIAPANLTTIFTELDKVEVLIKKKEDE